MRTPWDAVSEKSRDRTAMFWRAMLTAQNMVYIDGWVGFSEQVPRAHDTCSGIDQGAVHIEETM